VREVVEEQRGAFVVPVAGFICAGLEDGPATVNLLLLHADFVPRAEVRLPADRRDLVLSLVTRRARVESALSTDDSELRLRFDLGDAVVVPPDPSYEAWEVTGPGRFKLVAAPGGGEPAIWAADGPAYTWPKDRAEIEALIGQVIPHEGEGT
jgi:hypothetical protein